jgi:signal transduction histidine kinase
MDFLRLQYGEVFDQQILQILSEVERQSERAIALLDDLLDLAQVGHVEPAKHLTCTTDIVNEVIEELATNLPEDEHQAKVSSLPDTWVPETLIYQVFANLISNAYHYAPAENGPIEIGCWQEGKRQIFYVRDQGPGVPASERETVFDIFYRGKVSQKSRGTGVGLAIVRKIALRCNGSAWVEDTPGGGATFCINFPVKPSLSGKMAGTS